MHVPRPPARPPGARLRRRTLVVRIETFTPQARLQIDDYQQRVVTLDQRHNDLPR
jgi:hypothetical protein